jgi:hypothetical protein
MRIHRMMFLGAAMFAASLAVGCSSQTNLSGEYTGASVRRDMSPELLTLSEQREQRRNRIAWAMDETWRQIYDDWDEFWLVDEPIHLTPYPIPSHP